MPLNIAAAIAYLDSHAHPKSTEACALYVRLALAAGGVDINPHPRAAKDYGPYLLQYGFKRTSHEDYTPKAGDIAVIQNYSTGNPAGHITMYDGKKWASDFNQRDMWSGPGFRAAKPPYEIYRP